MINIDLMIYVNIFDNLNGLKWLNKALSLCKSDIEQQQQKRKLFLMNKVSKPL